MEHTPTEEEIRNWLKNFSFAMSSYGIKLPEDLSNPSEVAKVIRQQAITEERERVKKIIENSRTSYEKDDLGIREQHARNQIIADLTQE